MSAILLYAILLFPDGVREQTVISWNLPFPNYAQCEIFYLQNNKNLKGGVVTHGNSVYEEGMTLVEMGCTKVVFTEDGPSKDRPEDRRIHYQKGKDI